MKIRFLKQSSTHMPILIRCMLNSKGTMIEMGTGLFSTPIFHWFAKEMGRNVVSYDDNQEWFEFARRFRSRYHRIRFVENWKKLDIKGHYGVALIDQSTKARTPMAIALKDKVDYVVIHDTDSNHPYHYDKIWPHYKYRYDYIQAKPNTAVVSNFNDLEWLKNSPS